jgi:tRNA(fMet)-specific endonuclease VapC
MADLLDTNTCVEYLRQRNSAVVARITATPPGDIRPCSVVKAELYHGAHRSQQVQQNLLKVENFLRLFVSIPFEDDAAREYGRLRTDLERRGLAIGLHDLQIAAIALVHGLTLATHDTREFHNVDGLNLEDWQASP